MSNPNLKTLALGSLALAAFVVSQAASAHTRLETSVVPEGTRAHNYVNIGHGCPPTTARNPTFGTSVVFPNAVNYTPVIGVDSGAGKVYSTKAAADFYSPLSGIGAYIRGGGAWSAGNNKVDAAGNKDGFWAGGQYYDQSVSSSVVTPFYSAAVSIVKTSCARSVTFVLAIADFCAVNVPGTTVKDEEVLFWSPIPNFTGVPGQPFGTAKGDTARSIPVGPAYSKYDGYQDAAHTIPGDGWGSPATLKITRNLVTNPLPAGCTGNGGTGDDVYVYPSAEQINKELPVWSGQKQDGTLYWQ